VKTLQFFEFSKWPINKIFSVFQDGGRHHQNWSFHCGDIAILQSFKMVAAAIVDF